MLVAIKTVNLWNIILQHLNKKGSILMQTLLLFFIFISVYSPVVTLTLFIKNQDALKEKAFKRMDMEIAALEYYHAHSKTLKHDDAMYDYNHWITYWFKEDYMIIWFDGFYDYTIRFDFNSEGTIIKRTYAYD